MTLTNTKHVALVSDVVNDLRELAAWLEANADRMPDTHVYVPSMADSVLNVRCSTAEELADATRWLGTVEKTANASFMQVVRKFGRFGIEAYASRDEVCEQVQVGVETVEVDDATATEALDAVAAAKAVYDAAVAAVPKVTVEQPVMEWDCKPILAHQPTREENLAHTDELRDVLDGQPAMSAEVEARRNTYIAGQELADDIHHAAEIGAA